MYMYMPYTCATTCIHTSYIHQLPADKLMNHRTSSTCYWHLETFKVYLCYESLSQNTHAHKHTYLHTYLFPIISKKNVENVVLGARTNGRLVKAPTHVLAVIYNNNYTHTHTHTHTHKGKKSKRFSHQLFFICNGASTEHRTRWRSKSRTSHKGTIFIKCLFGNKVLVLPYRYHSSKRVWHALLYQ